MVQPPNPIVTCARCLWSIGYGYDRISRLLYGTSKEKHRVYRWRKYHEWPDHQDAFQAYITIVRRRPRSPLSRDYTPQSLEEKERRQQIRFSKKTKRRLRTYLATCINQYLRHGLYVKSVQRLVGCTGTHLKSHLESLFQAEMNWSNYGSYWEIDHIKPVHSFNIHDPVQRKTCYHFSNLQPLSCHQNRRKAFKIQGCVKTG